MVCSPPFSLYKANTINPNGSSTNVNIPKQKVTLYKSKTDDGDKIASCDFDSIIDDAWITADISKDDGVPVLRILHSLSVVGSGHCTTGIHFVLNGFDTILLYFHSEFTEQ